MFLNEKILDIVYSGSVLDGVTNIFCYHPNVVSCVLMMLFGVYIYSLCLCPYTV
jgi:hypothetical protein